MSGLPIPTDTNEQKMVNFIFVGIMMIMMVIIMMIMMIMMMIIMMIMMIMMMIMMIRIMLMILIMMTIPDEANVNVFFSRCHSMSIFLVASQYL